jgi:cytochrome c peroxidase
LAWVCGAVVVAVAAWQFTESRLMPATPSRSDEPVVSTLRSSEPLEPIPAAPALDGRKVALGQRLFHDPRLSRDNTVSCASCHLIDQGGADGAGHSKGIRGQLSDFNSPTVFNSALNFRQFWNGRAPTLEAQIDGPLHHRSEMGTTWTEVLGKLVKDVWYAREFGALYPNGLQAAAVKDAIATFERSLHTPDSRFDRYLKGDVQAMSLRELDGYQKFKSYGCVACHQGAAVGGNMFARLGVMQNYFSDPNNMTPADLGRFAVTGRAQDMHVFKVPSLRNVALTAPYLHDGSAPRLEDAVQVMGIYQLGIAIPADDAAAIVAFLRTLTGEYAGKPL